MDTEVWQKRLAALPLASYGAGETVFSDGTKTVANEAYVRESIREPAAKVVRGFEKSDTGMPSYEGVLSDAQIEALILYIKTLK